MNTGVMRTVNMVSNIILYNITHIHAFLVLKKLLLSINTYNNYDVTVYVTDLAPYFFSCVCRKHFFPDISEIKRYVTPKICLHVGGP